jgi:cobalt-zinc-cadmium efflux system protein
MGNGKWKDRRRGRVRGNDEKEECWFAMNHQNSSQPSNDSSVEWKASRRGLWIAIGVTGTVMVIEFLGGIFSNSLALMSDAGHMMTDLMSLTISLFAIHLTLRPATTTKTYGLHRMEILAALFNGSTLIVICFFIIREAYHRFKTQELVDPHMMIGVALLGLLANGISIWALMPTRQRSLNIRGAYLHILGDGLSSIGVIIGGLIIAYTQWFMIDPLISLAICGVIAWGAIGLVREAFNILLEAAPRDIDLGAIQEAVRSIPGVKEMHHVHLWTITSGIHSFSAHVVVGNVLTSHTTEILKHIKKILREKFNIGHTTIQFECENCKDGDNCNMERACPEDSSGPSSDR